MIPDWMKSESPFEPPRDGGSFVRKTIAALGGVLSRLQVQRGREGRLRIPPVWKLLLLLGMILAVSLLRTRLVLMGITAAVLVCLCFWPADRLLSVLRSALAGACLSLVLFLPAMLLYPASRGNHLTVVWKVFLSLAMVNMYNRSTQWNQVTAALRKLRIPGVFVFTLDLTLKYIVLLGTLVCDLLTALSLRAVGKAGKRYGSVGSVMGVTFVRSVALSRETYEAMVCRGYTDDEKGL